MMTTLLLREFSLFWNLW